MKLLRRLWQHKGRVLLGVFVVSLLIFFMLPVVSFDSPRSQVVRDRDGALLSAHVAADEQWRLSLSEEIPERYVDALIAFEDKRYHSHWGVDLLALARALISNVKAMRVVSGASTISMQVVRLSQHNPPRTLFQKAKEALLALRLESVRSKNEILNLYAENAPYGGNIVGLEAACWRYFARTPSELTWAEAATLAVLPNSPALVRPGRNQKRLQEKRNRLLRHLRSIGKLSDDDLRLALLEPLPQKARSFPQLAPHVLARMKSGQTKTTLDKNIQRHFLSVLKRHQKRLSGSGVHNLAAVAVDVESGAILAYVGNIYSDGKHEDYVDVAKALRSPGSTLKPFVFERALALGEVQAHEILPDVPLRLGGFSPENFDSKYDGAVRADLALARSLNVPASVLLQRVGVAGFLRQLKKGGISTLTKPSSHYGLSLVLGGVEIRLDELTGLYADLARRALGGESKSITPYFAYSAKKKMRANPFDADSAYLTLEALLQVQRPGDNAAWRNYANTRQVAWKTGTSFGFRDAWAMGVTPQVAIGVWTGNASGEGRATLTGHNAAAPVLFDLFDYFQKSAWFEKPKDLGTQLFCQDSGMRASRHCPRQAGGFTTTKGKSAKTCSYCQSVMVHKKSGNRVNASCANISDMVKRSYFVLPPIMHSFAEVGRGVRGESLPPFEKGCGHEGQDDTALGVISPKQNTQLYIPTELNGEAGKAIFEATHKDDDAVLYWHIDDDYIGSTESFHQVEVRPNLGAHTLRVIDPKGRSVTRTFYILNER